MKTPSKRQLRIEFPANQSAVYSNNVMISHTNAEVIFDFIQIMPNDPRLKVQQRIVMTPASAKMFLNAFAENVRRYEGKHGEINLPPRPQSLAEQLFKSVASDSDKDDEADDDDTEDNGDDSDDTEDTPDDEQSE